ncbi:MAG: M48 family metallopeptidase [Candidatus Binatia bacterium]
MRQPLRSIALTILFLLLAAAACTTVPYTRRSQLMLVSESTIDNLGVQAYQEALSKERIDHSPEANRAVTNLGQRIAEAAAHPAYQWQFAVLDDPTQANAFALPGGKVAVYTGLFPVAHDTAGLAAVIGHEVGHVVAHHAAERMSQGMLLQLAAGGLSVALGAQSPATRDAIMQAFGLGAQYGVLLPFSRSQESEADRIGLILMAKAGYDPHAALDLWRRFEARGTTAPPEFLSTHPSYGTREHNINSWLPEAIQYFQPSHAPVVSLPTIAVPR